MTRRKVSRELIYRSVKTGAAALVTAALIVYLAQGELGQFGVIDTSQYWAAAQVALNGGNPYDAQALHVLERSAIGAQSPIALWNPPNVLFWIGWLAVISDFNLAASVWLVTMAAAFVGALALAARAAETSIRSLAALLFLFTFYPLAISLYYGQLSPLLLLGFSAYLVLRFGPAPRLFLSGAALSITLLKPHLLFLVFLYETASALRERRFAVLVGLLGALGLQLAAAIAIDPDIFAQYLSAASSPPLNFQTPTLGSWLQGLTGIHTIWIRIIPAGAAALILIGWLARGGGRTPREDLFMLVPFSLLASPYGWTYDHLLVLPGALVVLASGDRMLSAILILANVALCLPLGDRSLQSLVWYPVVHGVVLAIWYGRCRGG